MNTMSFRGVSRFAICISLLSLGLRSGSAADTQSRSSQAPPASDFPAARFQKAITALANANSITIVAEGAPVEFDEKKLQDGTYKTAPLARKIALLAEAADYSAKNSGGVFLLMKRYSNPRDLPCVTLEECRLSLENPPSQLAFCRP